MQTDSLYSLFPGKPEDYHEITAVWKESVLITHGFLEEKDFRVLERDLPVIFLPSLRELWLCRNGKHLAGFCGNNGSEVEMLFIRPCYMRKGLGKLLLEHVRKLHGPLQLAVNEQNENALAFYLHCGFEVAGRSAQDSQGRPYPLLHLKQQK